MKIFFVRTFAIAMVLVLTATGLWAGGADETGAAAAAEKRYVTDPATGKVIVAPQYGGSIAEAIIDDPEHADTWWGSRQTPAVTLLLEAMGVVDWSTAILGEQKLRGSAWGAMAGGTARKWSYRS